MKELETTLESWFAKLPNLPVSIRAALVKLAPYLAIVGLVLSLPAILALLGLGAIAGPLMMSGGMYGGTLALVFAIASVALLALSIRGLFARTATGWQYLYYNALVGAAYSLLRLDVFGLIIGTGISLYLLFQIRSYYK
jgi:hypothetical protein